MVSDSILRHPLTLLVAGAILSGLVIPWLTRQWQYRQKSLEIRTALLAEISEAVMEFMMAVQFVHLGKQNRSSSSGLVRPEEQAEFDSAYKAWEVKSAIIGTKLQAYFPRSVIPENWTKFADTVTRFYALEGIRESRLPAAMTELARQIPGIAGDQLNQSVTWAQMRQSILKWKADMLATVLQAKVRLA